MRTLTRTAGRHWPAALILCALLALLPSLAAASPDDPDAESEDTTPETESDSRETESDSPDFESASLDSEATSPDSEGTSKLQLQSGDLEVVLGGYGSFRLEANDASEVADSMTLRRFVVTTDARFRDRLQVYSEIEYERLSEIEVERSVAREAGGLEFEQELEGTNASEIALEQAWGQFNFSEALGVRFGAVLPPVGRFNLRHDDNNWNFPRRTLIDRSASVLPGKAAWTEMGLGVVGETEVGGGVLLSYQGYLLNGVSLDFAIEEKVQTRVPKRNKLLLEAAVSPTPGAFDGSNSSDALAGRLQVSPRLGSEIAVSAYHGEYTPEFLDTSASITTFGVDGVHRIGPVEVEGEFLYTTFSDLQEVLTDFARVAVDQATETESEETATLESEIEIELDGLSEDRYGFWLDLSYPIPLEPGTLGLDNAVVIPVFRYEQVWFDQDVDEFGFSGGAVTELEQVDREQNRLSVGMAFRPVSLAVFHFVYERNDALEGALLDPGIGEDTTNAFTFGMAFGF